ncbi:MAG: hypothetical protein IPJ32_10330 [Sphingobacteriaceae bacterium]|nr:hypothetical protein [Sphingobacteriaceae bacterium]
MLQNVLHFKWIKPLKGAYVEVQDTEFSVATWFDANYQNKKEEYVNQNFGLRNYYVRFNNQIDYSLFNKANVAKLVVGKGGFLYEDDYINAYFGKNFIGEEKLEERFKKLKTVQDLLASQGTVLEVVFAPGKASFYPEFIPDNWRSEKKLNNYEYARDLCKKLGLTYVDLNAWFILQKDLSPYDLYPKTGIHWSNYGSLLAIDSLKNHIQAMSGLKLRSFIIDNVGFSDSLQSPDNDIGEAMNLLNDIQTLPMPYANYHWQDDNGAVKPKALFIGDSYFWNIYYQGLTNNFFTDCKFWYYNETVYPESEPERSVKKLNLSEELKKYQVIVLMATDCNVHDIGWGFVDQVYDLYKEDLKDALRKKVYVKLLSENIRRDKVWLADVERKAKEKNISVEEMITLDAIYIYKTEYCKPGVPELLDETIARIKNTKPWIEDIAKKAKEKNVSFEEMMEMDAKYIYDTELKQK